MKNRWNDIAVVTNPRASDAVWEGVHGSRALGADASLVLHGGGNSSIKDRIVDVVGDEIDVIYVKGSGWDLATIEPAGLTGMRLDRLKQLADVPFLTDAQLVNELRNARLDSTAPDPSIESLLHALIPHRAVLHSHADVVVALTDQPDPEVAVRRVLGDDVIVVPYVMAGFSLARVVADILRERDGKLDVPLVLAKHGLFTFGDTMREAYNAHLDVINRIEAVVPSAQVEPARGELPPTEIPPRRIARLRKAISVAADAPMIVRHERSPRIDAFVHQATYPGIALRGCATPEHSIRTKRLPVVEASVHAIEKYADEYEAYFDRNSRRYEDSIGQPLLMLDAAPRIVLDRDLGLFAAGKTVKDARIARDVALHTFDVIEMAEQIGVYDPLGEADLFDIEYWELEQAKLISTVAGQPLRGQVALVTGAASGIGAACAAQLLGIGAAVVGIDLADSIESTFSSEAWLGIQADATDAAAIEDAIRAAVSRFGGIDVLVVAAGIFAQSAPIAEIDPLAWARTMAVNVDGVLTLFRAIHPVLVESPTFGRVVVVGSKNAVAPGPGAASYSASKAAVTQLARVAALEWAPDGIRVNVVHPDAVFDTGLWTPELLEERSAKYGMTVEQYKRRNLLATEVTSRNVGELVGAMVTSPFAATTGAQVPIDGGNNRVI